MFVFPLGLGGRLGGGVVGGGWGGLWGGGGLGLGWFYSNGNHFYCWTFVFSRAKKQMEASWVRCSSFFGPSFCGTGFVHLLDSEPQNAGVSVSLGCHLESFPHVYLTCPKPTF